MTKTKCVLKDAISACAVLMLAQLGSAQSSILNKNLIVNGDAETGSTGTSTTAVAAIPGWTRATGNQINVLAYGITGALLTDPAPPDHGLQFFSVPPSNTVGTMSQTIDVSSAASAIAAGSIKYMASAYLGYRTSQLIVAFQNVKGQTFNSVMVGTIYPGAPDGGGEVLNQQIGQVPAGTTQVLVTLSLGTFSKADSLSLVLSAFGTSPSSVLGTNLVVNGNAEAGPSVIPGNTALYIPGWSTDTAPTSVAPYGGVDSGSQPWIQVTDASPSDRGAKLFCGATGPSSMYQDIDVSPAATLIDSGMVKYEVAAWLGGLTSQATSILTYTFFDWSGNQLAPTGQLSQPSHTVEGMFDKSNSDVLPAGTRRVHIGLSFPTFPSMADDIKFVLSTPGGTPAIELNSGVISASAFGGFTSIGPTSWIEIYGGNLTSSPLRNNCAGFAGSCWQGSDFVNGIGPTSLDGVSVSIGGQPAFIDFASPGQINAQVPSNAPVGPVLVTVTNANGTSDGFPITVNQSEPGVLAPASFTVGGKQYVAALFADGVTFALPVNAIPGVPSRPAHVGETIVIYGVGFGAVSGGFTAGTIVTAQNALTTPVQFLFGTTPVTPAYMGLAPSFVGLYQFNIIVPSVPANAAEPLTFTTGGVTGQKLYIAVDTQ